MHRRFWNFATCTACHGHGKGACEVCNLIGYFVFPREDLRIEDLCDEWRALLGRYGGQQGPAPAIIVTTAALADSWTT